MNYKLIAYGHSNILATHKTTLEFTKDKEISKRGNCIVGANADFELSKIKEFIKNSKNNKILITIETISKITKIKETILAEINPSFNSDEELVIRKTDFLSDRTFAINADKSAFELDRGLIGFLRGNGDNVRVSVENKA